MEDFFHDKFPKELPSQWREFYRLAMEFAAEIKANEQAAGSNPESIENSSTNEEMSGGAKVIEASSTRSQGSIHILA